MNEITGLLFATPSFAVLGIGFLLGLKHATEADHLAAVSTMVSERKSLWSSTVIGGLWGLGHTISLFIAGVLVLMLNFNISENTERLLELGVGIMLTLLGLNVARKVISGGQLHFHTHEHGTQNHAHPHIHNLADDPEMGMHHEIKYSPRALMIGMVHGLAGSAALMLLIIPTISSKMVGMLYIAIFGIGSIGGMMLMSFLVGLPFYLTSLRFNRFNGLLQAAAAFMSIALGLWIVYEKAFSHAQVL